jgi:hypothetical protein
MEHSKQKEEQIVDEHQRRFLKKMRKDRVKLIKVRKDPYFHGQWGIFKNKES